LSLQTILRDVIIGRRFFVPSDKQHKWTTAALMNDSPQASICALFVKNHLLNVHFEICGPVNKMSLAKVFRGLS
jgi:hypothetical protein